MPAPSDAPGADVPAPEGAAAPLPCGNCGLPLRPLTLAGHYGSAVEIDFCAPCHLVWFDAVESARLAGLGLLALMGEMATAQRAPHHALRAGARCPRCAGALKAVHNRTRWGATQQLECRRGHGAWQTFGQFLAERGLARAAGSGDRARLAQAIEGGALHCLNCGAPDEPGRPACRHCGGAVGVIDVARLAAALDPEGATEGHPVHGTPLRRADRRCAACGAAQGGAEASHCDHCGATLVCAALAEAHARVQPLAPALAAHAEQPAAHVRARRLVAQAADLPRRREWVAEMERSAGTAGQADPRGDDLDLTVLARKPSAWAAAVAALALWWWWR